MSSSDFSNTDIYKRGDSRNLIVFLHGYGPFAKKHLRAITKVITGESLPIRTGWTLLSTLVNLFFLVAFIALSAAAVVAIFHPSWLPLPLAHQRLARIVAIGLLALVVAAMVIVAIILYLLPRSFGSDDSDNGAGGQGGESDSLGIAIETIAEEAPDADLLVPFYEASFFSNADPFWLASRLDDLIASTWESRIKRGAPYEHIVLIGHSIGALLVRKAYVYALGVTDDHPVSFARHQRPKAWSSKVERLILFAPMNRGWDIRPKPRNMGAAKFVFYWLLLASSAITGRALLLRGLRRGSIFISNLRIQWARLCRQDDVTVAPMIMLLGDVDDLVSQADHQDVAASGNFIHIPVSSSGHGSIVKFHAGARGKIRTEAFRKALSVTIDTLKSEYDNSTRGIRDSPIVVPHAHITQDLRTPGPVVFVMHGIRDFGHWTREVGVAIRAVDTSAIPITSGYGYFPILRFLLLGSRQRKVRIFMDWYAERVAASGEQDISYIGHSNGTYILAAALTRYATVRFKNVALLASIVPRSFPWNAYVASGRVNAIRTDLSSDDSVVALFGGFFEFVRENLNFTLGSFGEIGSSGFHGFSDTSAHTYESRYFPGGHGGPLIMGNHHSLAKFAVSGVSEVEPGLLVTRQSRWVSRLGAFSVPAVFIMGCVLFLVGYGCSKLIHTMWNISMLTTGIVYWIVVIAILLFV
jgi:pimeloyl-ACP methyl ester carboxylesterase